MVCVLLVVVDLVCSCYVRNSVYSVVNVGLLSCCMILSDVVVIGRLWCLIDVYVVVIDGVLIVFWFMLCRNSVGMSMSGL